MPFYGIDVKVSRNSWLRRFPYEVSHHPGQVCHQVDRDQVHPTILDFQSCYPRGYKRLREVYGCISYARRNGCQHPPTRSKEQSHDFFLMLGVADNDRGCYRIHKKHRVYVPRHPFKSFVNFLRNKTRERHCSCLMYNSFKGEHLGRVFSFGRVS